MGPSVLVRQPNDGGMQGKVSIYGMIQSRFCFKQWRIGRKRRLKKPPEGGLSVDG
jgi:hypothetical protein